MSKIDSKYLQSLKETLDIERMKTQRSVNMSSSDHDKRQEVINNDYRINGEYYYNRELQNQDFDTLKMLYRKVATNFFILNSSVKDIIYKWPEKKKSIENIIQEEKEKLEIGGNNSYSNKLYAYLTDGETVNKKNQDDLTYREFDLPKKFPHESDIDRDPMFEFKKPALSKKLKR